MSALTFATAQILRVLPRAGVSRVMGRLAEHEWSAPLGRAVVGLYTKAYDVRLEECDHSGDWRSFDEFFTRPLRQGVRPLHGDDRTIISPADGRLDAPGDVDAAAVYWVKGRSYRAAELLGSDDEAERYRGGRACVIYLSPRDYHRVHSPVTGVVTEVRSMAGDYFPVNAIGIRHVPNLFAINRRVAIAIDSRDFGRVTLVMVAAIVVGRVTVSGIAARDVPEGTHRLASPLSVSRGDEVGVFHLGSTVVMFMERGVQGPWLSREGAVRLGDPLLRQGEPRARPGDATEAR
ncbi:MAG: phosphatidylserine decarboxylase [Myxococcales bacterium]|nr:phosphatidylserine decarboxylase [Myxococcales bacterium]